ncbi:hypothetical protein AC579_2514 [Pseudocercospora musae]|uniref:Glycosyltransferase family 8 protein n=1 Tax=Pseudocercospora musae TaxID=113226 RepID=A0A139GV71_9PEZI|nr:hypothetical protein AC579_2514 [Pseudocercospora musae]
MARHDSLLSDSEDGRPTQIQTRGYITLITKANYLAGVVLLAHTLREQGSQYPLIVLYTASLSAVGVKALELEAERSSLILRKCDLLIPPARHQLNVAVDRFTDTWTKLRVFEAYNEGFETLCYLDADMMLFGNMDSVFEDVAELPLTSIAAVHDCVCSPDKMPWTPASYTKENCALTRQTHPKALVKSKTVKPGSPDTYHLFNSGMFVFHPRWELWSDVLDFFMTTDLLGSFKFPDQDFMVHFFRNRWVSLSWKYNAVKTMAYRHKNIWREEGVVCLHYIVDKPWAKRIGKDGIAGFKKQDGATHSWWWTGYENWMETRRAQGEFAIVDIMAKHVARKEDEFSDEERPDMGSIGARVHDVTNLSHLGGRNSVGEEDPSVKVSVAQFRKGR